MSSEKSMNDPMDEESMPKMDGPSDSVPASAPPSGEEASASASAPPSGEEASAPPSGEEESLEGSEQDMSETKPVVKDEVVLESATNFRKKLKNTKKRLPSMDDEQKDEIRNGVIREFINVLKISKKQTTRKKHGRRINNLRNVFHETLNLLNGTSKRRPKRKSRKQKQESQEMPPQETPENQP